MASLTALGARDRLVLLHCVSCYPTPLEALNLRAMGALRREFGTLVGLSDHTTGCSTGALAAAAGACVIEKHFTLNKSQSGPDHAMSLSPHELRTFVAAIRDAEAALGDGRIGLCDSERDVRRVARRSIVTAHTIPAGTRLTEEMLTARRPGTGLSPAVIDRLVGCVTRQSIAAGVQLSWDMLEAPDAASVGVAGGRAR